jgi:hypothetical protein
MGCVPSKEEREQMQREARKEHPREAKEKTFEQRLREKRERNIREPRELPRLKVKGHKVVAYGATYAQGQTHRPCFADGGAFGSNGIGALPERAAIFNGFVCKCRVSKRTEPWDSMTRTRCDLWCEAGDLMICEAEKIIKQYGIDDVDGATRLKRVYVVLDTGSPDL